MEHLSVKDQIRVVLLVLLSCLSLYIYFTMPYNLVGVYPRLAALITWVSFFGSLCGIAFIYFNDKPNGNKSLAWTLLVILLFGAGGGIPGVLLTGIKFKKSMESHLSKYGVITTATINHRAKRTVYRRFKKHEGFDISYSYQTQEGKIINAWEAVSELEYLSVSEGDKINVIYSTKNENMVDLLITSKSLEEYKDLIQKKLEEGSTFEKFSDTELRSIVIQDQLTVNILDLSNGQWNDTMNLDSINKDLSLIHI